MFWKTLGHEANCVMFQKICIKKKNNGPICIVYIVQQFGLDILIEWCNLGNIEIR